MQKRLMEALAGQNGNHIIPFFWQHGENHDLLREGMEKIFSCGIRAVCLESRTHPDFLADGWWNDLEFLIQTAKELGMKLWILDDSHFPTGRCNDTISTDSPYRKIVLTRCCVDAVGPMKAASFIAEVNQDEAIEAIVAGRRDPAHPYHLSDLVDLTDRYCDGVVEWDVPSGVWSVTIMKKANCRTGRPHYANLIDASASRHLIDTVYEPHFAHCKAEFGKTIAGFFSDEPEIGNSFKEISDPNDSLPGNPEVDLPWCEELKAYLLDCWKENYPFALAALWNQIDADSSFDQTGNVRRVFMDAVTRLYQKNFCEQVGTWCRTRGVEYIGHVIEEARLGPGVGHYFRGLWGQDMAGIDVVLQSIRPQLDDMPYYRVGGRGDRVVQGTAFSHYGLGKLCSSLAQIDPKKQGRALCEIFGAYGWSEGVRMMKWLTDHMLVRGVNWFVPHAFTMKDFPDEDCPPHFYARGMNPQFDCFQDLMKYTNRICHLINGGTHNPGIGILYSADLEWIQKDVMPFYQPGKHLMRNQIDFDVIPLDYLLSGKVSEGRLEGAKEIGLLIVPACRYITRAMADWCIYAHGNGLKMIFLDQYPDVLEPTGQISRLDQICGEVERLDHLAQAAKSLGYGLQAEKTDPYLRYYHYEHEDGAFYLFFNESARNPIRTQVRLKVPEGYGVCEYDGWDNQLRPAVYEEQTNTLLLALAPSEMRVYAVGKGEDLPRPEMEPELIWREMPDAVWEISLKSPTDSEFYNDGTVCELSNLTANNWHPHFSGTIRYKTELTSDREGEWDGIDLGEVGETAKVWINGQLVGSKISPPYRFWVKDAFIAGTNQIEVEVTNTLVHKIRDAFSRHMPVEPSGLMGPVCLFQMAK